jgi:hypothetical protein
VCGERCCCPCRACRATRHIDDPGLARAHPDANDLLAQPRHSGCSPSNRQPSSTHGESMTASASAQFSGPQALAAVDSARILTRTVHGCSGHPLQAIGWSGRHPLGRRPEVRLDRRIQQGALSPFSCALPAAPGARSWAALQRHPAHADPIAFLCSPWPSSWPRRSSAAIWPSNSISQPCSNLLAFPGATLAATSVGITARVLPDLRRRSLPRRV